MATRYLITGGGSVTWDNSDTSIWSATSGGSTGASVPGASDDVIMDGSSGGGTVTLNYSPTVISITMGAFTGTFNDGNFSPTMGTFNYDGTATRTITKGTGTWVITGNNTTIWNGNTTTNLTFTDVGTINFTYSGSTGTRTISAGSVGQVILNNINISAGTDIINWGTHFTGLLNTTGFTGTFGLGSGRRFGSIVFDAGMTFTSTANLMDFTSTTTGKTITTNGVQINCPITFTGVGGGWTLQDNLDMGGASDRTLTLTNGSFDSGGRTITAGAIISSNSNTRVLTLTGSTVNLSSTGTAYDVQTFTGLTVNASTTIFNFTSASSVTVSLRSFNYGTLNFPNATTIILQAGNPVINTLTVSGSPTITLGSSFAWNVANFTPATSTVVTSGNSQGMTSYGQSFYNLTINNLAGQPTTLQDALICTNLLTVTQGTLNANNFNVTCANFLSSNANTREITMGSGTWALTGTGTVWDTSTTTGLTITPDTSTIKITDTSASSKTFSGGSSTFSTLWLAGRGTFIVGTTTNALTLTALKIDNSPKTVQIFAGKTINVASAAGWDVQGTTGSNLITLESTTPATAWNLVIASGAVVSQSISLQDSAASGGATFTANDSFNVSGNSGWVFGTAVTSQNAKKDDNSVNAIFAVSSVDNKTLIRLQADPSTGALLIQTE